MRHVAFVTTELDPHTPGGAGAVVARLSERLRSQGATVTVFLVTDQPVEGAPGLVTVAPEVDEAEPAVARSKAAHRALESFLGDHEVDLIEFQDFDGLAFWSLTHRAGSPLATVPIAIRYHHPADHMLDAIGVERPELDVVRVMERESLAACDAVIVQAPSTIALVDDRYHTGADRIVVGVPPIPAVGRVRVGRSARPRFVVIGRLGEPKGSHDAVRAFAPILERHPEVTLEFVGGDGWSATADLPMTEWLPTLAPDSVRDRIVFTGPIDRADLPEHLSGAWAVVVPSRIESFGLAAHEARAMGLPVISRRLPAIEDYLGPANGALLYDEATEGLRQVIDEVLADPSILDTLADAPLPTYGDPSAPYVGVPPIPRHPQAQAGHATAAMHRLEDAMREPTPRVGAAHRAARGMLRMLPDRVAAAAVAVIPSPIKDRFRDLASWPEEQERRREKARRDEVRSRVAAGGFPILDRPRVSIVIPCHNHGTLVDGALTSVFEQTFASWEVVVVDDGSTEATTLDALDAIDLPRVRVIRQDNTGLPGARNAGIRATTGEYIVPLDADDELLPDYLERMVEALDRSPRAAFAHCWAELFGDVNWIWATRPYNQYMELVANSVLQTATIRRAAWDDVGGYDTTMVGGNEDWDLWLRFQEAGWGNIQIRAPLYRYRKQGISMSVTNEAAFEEHRKRLMQRHPGLYAPAAVLDVKAEHYPLVSLVVRGHVPPDAVEGLDAQIVDADLPWCDAVRSSRGKYVADLRDTAFDRAVVVDLIDVLEADASLPAAGDPATGITIMRRWAVVDPGSWPVFATERPDAVCPEPEWMVPERMLIADRELDVVRQQPEESGRPPDWAVTP